MIKVITAQKMRDIDRLSMEKYAIPSILLMENAAHAVANVIYERVVDSLVSKKILILCGKGNNGGDGAAIGRILAMQGADVDVLLFGRVAETEGDARINFDLFTQQTNYLDGKYASDLGFLFEINSEKEFEIYLRSSEKTFDVVIDALFGTGLTRPLDGVHASSIRRINILNKLHKSAFAEERLIVSVDMPSGLNSDLGDVGGEVFQADITVTFTAPKAANILAPTANANGELLVVDIGSPLDLLEEQSSQLFLAEEDDVAEWLFETEFTSASYKNKRGHTLLFAGSDDYAGAAVLSANAAMLSGTGLVTAAVPKSSMPLIVPRLLPEIMTKGISSTDNGTFDADAIEKIELLIKKANAIAIGCGIGRDEVTGKFVRKVLNERTQPIVVDADALSLLSPFDTDSSNEQPPLILTPHEGEFMRLLDSDDKTLLNDRVNVVRKFAQKHNVILVLKGERVLIGAPSGKVVVNPTGNAGLGKAGNGDTLTGIIVGFVTQSFSLFDSEVDHRDPFELAFDATVAAVYIAGMAGDIVLNKFGPRVMTATDVRNSLTEAFDYFEGDR